MLYYALRITDETLAIATKLNDGIRVAAEFDEYVIFTQDPKSLDFSAVVLTNENFRRNFPNADKEALLQLV